MTASREPGGGIEVSEPSESRAMFDERTEAIQAQNTRITWLVVTLALFVDVFYREAFLGQEPAEFLDLLIILGLAVLLQGILDGARGVFTFSPREVRLVFIPGFLFGILLYLGSEIGRGTPVGEAVFEACGCAVLGLATLLAIAGFLKRKPKCGPPTRPSSG